MASVTIKNLFKEYENGFKAVHGINLEIQNGEFMVFVGPSGCAKSTTLRMIAGLETVTSGEIYIGDVKVNDLPAKDRGIAMVFQNYALYPHKTVYQNMAFGLRMQKLPDTEIDIRVREAAEKLEITNLLNRKPKEMSGGQRQRVAVGRAIVRKPDVFLFDEPLSNLDAKLRVSMRVKIAQLHKSLKQEGNPATMIYVTHDQTEALTLGDRICVLDKGKIMQVDTPENLYNYPKNKFVAGFIGSPAMNIIEATIKINPETDMMFLEISNEIKLELNSSELNHKFSQLADFAKLNLQGKKVYFGIRPENISIIMNSEGQDINAHNAKITVIENMGNEKYIYFNLAEVEFIARVNEKSINNNDIDKSFTFKFDMNMCHIFDFETEESLIQP